MQREIKFRVWIKNERTSEMYMTETFKLDKEFDCLSGCFDGVIMQYTGLKDKNGKEIYEGDVCRLVFGGGEFEYIGRVEWYNLGWTERCVKDSGTNMGGYWPMNIYEFFRECEVIGNIYENKELYESITGK